MAKHLDFLPADLSADAIREMGSRAVAEREEASAKATAAFAESRKLMRRADKLLSNRDRSQNGPPQLAVSFGSPSSRIHAIQAARSPFSRKRRDDRSAPQRLELLGLFLLVLGRPS